MKTILYGNGFNRLNNGNSWEKLVHAIDDSKDVDWEKYKYRIPNTLQYEVKALTTIDIKDEIASEMRTYHSNDLFDELLDLNVNHFMTTNYDYVPDNTFEKKLGYSEYKKERDKSEAVYSIHRKRCFRSTKGASKKYLWYIHGELSNRKSVMLGYEHYCSYVGHIKKYISGEYNFAKRGDEKNIPKLNDRLTNTPFEVLSWIDLFFVSDIYIVGLGLYYDEIDLWWLLTLRKQKLEAGLICKNSIVFYGDCMPGKKKLLESLGVEVYIPKATDFPEKYKEYINDIKNR